MAVAAAAEREQKGTQKGVCVQYAVIGQNNMQNRQREDCKTHIPEGW